MQFTALTLSVAATLVPVVSASAAPDANKKEGASMNAGNKAPLVAAYRDMYKAMIGRHIEHLDTLLDHDYSLTHMTGYRQPRLEWLDAIKSGQMRYHSAQERSVQVELNGDTATVVGRSVVDATIYASRGTWNLQLATSYQRVNGKWLAMNTVATTF